MGLEPQGGRPDPKAGGEGGAGPSPSKGAGQANDAGEFDETKHPRAPDGKFGKGSGSSSGGQMGAGEAGSGGEKKQAGEVDKPGREPQMGGNSNGKKRQQSQASALYKPQKHTPEQVEAIANKIVAAFPGGAEAIARTLERLKSVPSTDKPVEEGGFRIYREDGSYDYTPERKAVHEQIVKNIFSDARVAAATPKDGEAPVVTLLGGRGGSGKSWISSKGPLAGKAIEAGGEVPEGMEGGTIVLDADFIKSQLPGYDGWKASKFHEESSDVLDMVDEYARKAGINVTLDATMKSESSIAKRIAAYEEMGYETEGHYMHLPPEEAATRAMARYAKGGKFDGRFVPPEVILGNVNNEQNFDTFSKRFRKWTVYENTGKAPRLVESSHDDE
jgi:predicted ABC-type ATPase